MKTTPGKATNHNRVGDVRVGRVRLVMVDRMDAPEDGQADRRELLGGCRVVCFALETRLRGESMSEAKGRLDSPRPLPGDRERFGTWAHGR